MSRLLRASILLAVLVVVATVGAAGCSYVDPPVLAMATSTSASPYYTLSREDMFKELNAPSTNASTSTTRASYSTEETSAFLNKKVQEEFLKHFMDEQHIEVTDADSQLATQQASSSQTGQPSPEQAKQQAQLIAINRKLAGDAYASGQVNKEQKLREYYEANKAQLGTPAQVCIHIIGLQAGAGDGSTAPTEAEYADAQTRAVAVKQRLATEPFEAVADSASQIPSAPKGGSVGCIAETRLPQDVLPGVSALAVGATSDPLRTEGGYFIIRLDERKPASQTPFEAVKDEIEQQVSQQIGQQLLREVLGAAIRRTSVTSILASARGTSPSSR